uniref:Uncharacterized protein n=1 Tax=Aegilops tauschii subsp. strangulata TaxID=200361 RepID=A0A453T339_AEGTS
GAHGGDPGARAGAVAGLRAAGDDGLVVRRRRGAGDGVRAGALVGRRLDEIDRKAPINFGLH